MPSEALHRVVIDVEDQPLPTGHKQSMRISVWMADPQSPEALNQQARNAAIAFIERALLELRADSPVAQAQAPTTLQRASAESV